jgi:hypothetical protein
MSITTDTLKDGGTNEADLLTYLGGDDHINEESIHDPLEDIDAVKINKYAKTLAELSNRARPGNLVYVSFELATTPGSATTPIPRLGSALTKWFAHRDGTLVGITAQFETALTAGTATIEPKIDGTSTAFTLVLSGVQAGRAQQIPGNADATDKFDASALEALEVDVTTASATWAGADKLLVELAVSIGEEEDL